MSRRDIHLPLLYVEFAMIRVSEWRRPELVCFHQTQIVSRFRTGAFQSLFGKLIQNASNLEILLCPCIKGIGSSGVQRARFRIWSTVSRPFLGIS